MRFGVLKLELDIVMHIVQLLCEIYIIHTQYLRLSELLLRIVVYEYFSWQQFSIKALELDGQRGEFYGFIFGMNEVGLGIERCGSRSHSVDWVENYAEWRGVWLMRILIDWVEK